MKRIFSLILFTLIALAYLSDFPSTTTQQPDSTLQTNDQHEFSVTKSTIPKQPSSDISSYDIYLSDSPSQRYSQIISDKKQLLNEFINYLYQIRNFKYSMWLTKFLFAVLPQQKIRQHIGEVFFNECKGIADQSGRELYEIVVYNYMYEIGAAKDFCTSIALTQSNPSENGQKQNLSLLVRNLDYGFQKFLVKNTVKINFFLNQNDTRPSFTTLTHAGFVSTHTSLKYESSGNIQFAMSLNQRKSQSLLSTIKNIIFTGCESVFQLTNRIMATKIATIEELITLVSNSNSCSKFYFIIQVKNGDHVLIEKNQGVGVHRVYFEKAIDFVDKDTFYILQTNTDQDKKDPDFRRDQAVKKINDIVREKGYVENDDLKKVLFEPPNFNDQTLMTALIDLEKGEIQAIMWDMNAVSVSDKMEEKNQSEKKTN